MSKSVVLNLGQGDLNNGFPRVTVQLWTADNPFREQFIGSLPPAPHLINLYMSWQLLYKKLCDPFFRLSLVTVRKGNKLDDVSGGATNVFVQSFDDLCLKLQASINQWLKSEEFYYIDQQLRSRIDRTEEVQVIIESQDELLRRLPWHCSQFFQDYPYAEIGFAKPEYQRRSLSLKRPKVEKKKIRILAVLGNSKGLDLRAETQLLQTLEEAEVKFLVNPSRHEFNELLWDSVGWDILFFAGHSQTEGETGRMYINKHPTNNSLTIEKLEEAFKAAIENGLHLAIFNSCDGLGLASALEKMNIPTVIVMREPVSDLVAQEFFQHFMQAFAVKRLSLYLSVQQARRKLQGLEDECPGVSWLPVICMNPAVEQPTWLQIGGY